MTLGDNDKVYSANHIGSAASMHKPQKRHSGVFGRPKALRGIDKVGDQDAQRHLENGMTNIKFFLTNTGDVLRHIFVMQGDPFVDKASVLVTLQCGPVILVHKLPWYLWSRVPDTVTNQHEMANELLMLDENGRRLRLPMANVSQDCLTLTLTMPEKMAKDEKWSIMCVWDYMTKEWRSHNCMTPVFFDLKFPTPKRIVIESGQMKHIEPAKMRLGHRSHSIS